MGDWRGRDDDQSFEERGWAGRAARLVVELERSYSWPVGIRAKAPEARVGAPSRLLVHPDPVDRPVLPDVAPVVAGKLAAPRLDDALGRTAVAFECNE